jgi:hypothetical protein
MHTIRTTTTIAMSWSALKYWIGLGGFLECKSYGRIQTQLDMDYGLRTDFLVPFLGRTRLNKPEILPEGGEGLEVVA